MILAAALILDAIIGEPAWIWRRLPHPVVLMGRMIAVLEQTLNHGTHRKTKGVFLVSCLVVIGLGSGWLLSQWGMWAEVIIAAVLLAQKSLSDHVTAVADALRQDLPQARLAVSMIVGRDPQSLDQAGVSRAAVESAAENFSDGIVAPALWFAVLGLPGIITYKLINTSDSMIGYKSERYRDFGWAAAKLDDLVNLPASRLSALLIAMASFKPGILMMVPKEARKHASPNAGWPEAAMALAEGFALAGPRQYASGLSADAIIHASGRRELQAGDIEAALRLIWRAWLLLIILALACWHAVNIFSLAY